MSRPSQHKQLMERLDKLIVTLEEGNAIAVARLKFDIEIQASKKEPPPKKLIATADEQIKAALESQLARRTKED